MAKSRTLRHMKNRLRQYGADVWGDGIVSLNSHGHLVLKAPGLPKIDLQALALTLDAKGYGTPFVVRFPTLIEAQMKRLLHAFDVSINEYEYPGKYTGVYPVKVNQRREVFETVVQARNRFRFGLEVGAKPELLLSLAYPPTEKGLLICNGFKDDDYMRLTFHAAELGHRVIVVIERISEIESFLRIEFSKKWSSIPRIGLRAKLYCQGGGLWRNSSGERSKFGLTSNEILDVVDRLENVGKTDLLSLLHFHLGSQISQIRQIKEAVREGFYLWAALHKRCPSMEYIDVGGGIGVDYDGSRSSQGSSANYSVEEYASQVVFEIMRGAEKEGTTAPTLVTESGRFIVANHAITVVELREVQGDLNLCFGFGYVVCI